MPSFPRYSVHPDHPQPRPAPGMPTLEQMPAHWQGRIDFALDAGDLVLRHPALAALAAARGRSPAAALVD